MSDADQPLAEIPGTSPAAEPEAPSGAGAAGSGALAAGRRRRGYQRLARELAYVVILGTPVLLFFLVAMPRSNATRLMQRLQTVSVNQTRFNQVQALAAEFGDYAACVGDNCLFQFQNQWLHFLRLAPMTEFTVMVQRGGDPGAAGGGPVGAIDMAMLVSSDGSGEGGGALASALVFDRGRADGAQPYAATITFDAQGRPGRTVVTLSPASTARQRGRARGFNLRCLTKIGGCTDSHQLLPGVWSGVRRIQSVSATGGAPPRPRPGQ